MSDVYLNPLYDWLKYSSTIELEIAKKRSDYNSVALCLSCHDVFNSTKHSKEVQALKNSLEKKEVSPKDSIALAYLYKLNQESHLNLGEPIKRAIKDILRNLPITSIPVKIKILTYDIISSIKSKETDILKKFLLEKQKEWKQSNRISDLIEVDSVLENDQCTDICRRIDFTNNDLTIDKLAKLGIILIDNESKETSNIVNALEGKLRNLQSKSVLPKISLSVYEAEKLIDTNLPPRQLNEILDVLKKQQEWTRLIKQVQGDGITLDLEQLHNITTLSTEDIVFSIRFIQKAGRTHFHQVTPEQFDALKEYEDIKKRGWLVIKNTDIKRFCIATIILSVFYLFYWISIGLPSIRSLLSGKESFSNLPATINTLGDIANPPVAFYVGIRYYIRSWRLLTKKQRFGWNDIVTSLLRE